mgnify:CR=1 FL=1
MVDMTAGYGGHASEILKAIGEKGKLILIDQDPAAIIELRKKFKAHRNVVYIQSNFAKLDWEKMGKFDRALMDLGVSSPQLDEANRGFSFSKEAPLDMRMDQTYELTAKDIVNEYSEEDLADIIYHYGEERQSRAIARAIVDSRNIQPIETTTQLAEIVAGCVPKKGKIHPATKTFQALRIELNQELASLEASLPKVTDQLSKGGRLAVISFHSLEDRMVKRFFRAITESERDAVTGGVLREPNFTLVNKKPIKGSINDKNPRARSAMLRAVEKIN